MKRVLSLLLSLLLISGLAACQSSRSPGNSPAPESTTTPESTTAPAPKAKVKIGVLKGPTGIGSAYLMEKNDKGGTLNDYKFVTATAPTDLTGRLVSGELDMAALPTNVAATLYNKTKRQRADTGRQHTRSALHTSKRQADRIRSGFERQNPFATVRAQTPNTCSITYSVKRP